MVNHPPERHRIDIFESYFLEMISNLLNKREESFHVLYIPHSLEMCLGNCDSMSFDELCEIENSEIVFILVNFITGNLAVYDFAEYAVRSIQPQS